MCDEQDEANDKLPELPKTAVLVHSLPLPNETPMVKGLRSREK